ncbi:hypothetical protein GEMRC1_013632 [Eukaryota sp. GEM-RC1]
MTKWVCFPHLCTLILSLLILLCHAFHPSTLPLSNDGLFWHISSNCSIASHLSCFHEEDSVILIQLWISSTPSFIISNSEPTTTDAALTRELFSLGEHPHLTLRYHDIATQVESSPVTFNPSSSTFHLHLLSPPSPDLLSLSITPAGIVILDRSVGSASFFLSFLPDVTHFISPPFPLDSEFNVVIDPNTYLLALYSNEGLITSSSLFEDFVFGQLNSELFNNLYSICFVHDSHLLLSTDSGLIVSNYTNFNLIYDEAVFSKVLSFHLSSQFINVIAYSEESTSFFFSQDLSLQDYDILTIPSEFEVDAITSAHLCFGSIIFLVESNSNYSLIHYQPNLGFSLSLSFSSSSVPFFVSSLLETADVYVVTDEGFLFSPNCGYSFSQGMTISKDLLILNSFISNSGIIFGMFDFVQLTNIQEFNSSFVLLSVYSDIFVLFHPESQSRHVIEGSRELLNHTRETDDVDCPFIYFDSSLQSSYLIDMDETITGEVTIVAKYDDFYDFNLKLSPMISDYGLIRFDFERHTNIINPTLVESKLSFSISESKQITSTTTFSDRQQLGHGQSVFKVLPSQTSLACQRSFSSTIVNVGCSWYRSMVVEDVALTQLSYTEAQKTCPEYDVGGSKHFFLSDGVTREYDLRAWGCPIPLYHGTIGYVPELVIFHRLDQIRKVDVDYVMHEIFDRTDWTFSASFSDVECLGEPQFDEDFSLPPMLIATIPTSR